MSVELDEFIDKHAEVTRDAVHVAAIPVFNGGRTELKPGDRVAVIRHSDPVKVIAETEGCPAVGIVSPFLPCAVKPGDRFWVLMLPGTVTNLRHDWSHESIYDEAVLSDEDDGCRGCW